MGGAVSSAVECFPKDEREPFASSMITVNLDPIKLSHPASSSSAESTGETITRSRTEEIVFATAVIRDDPARDSGGMEVRSLGPAHAVERISAGMRPMTSWKRLLKPPSAECEKLLAVLEDTPDHVAPSRMGVSKPENDSILKTRIDAVNSLGDLGEEAEAAIPKLVSLLNFGNHAVSCMVPKALYAIDPEGYKTVPFLILHGFGSGHITTLTVPNYVASVLTKVAMRDPHWAIPVYTYVVEGTSLIVRDLEPDKRNHIRVYMLDVLGRLYRRLPQARSVILPVLKRCAQDNNSRVKDAANQQLRNIEEITEASSSAFSDSKGGVDFGVGREGFSTVQQGAGFKSQPLEGLRIDDIEGFTFTISSIEKYPPNE